MVYEIDLRADVTLYGQESCVWCGAASAQMLMNGYPDPANRVFHRQADIWNSIQTHNSTNPADSNWATDPQGLQGCVMDMNPPPSGGRWVVYSNTVRDSLMFSIMYWINRNRYPVATLINRGGHWVVIVDFISDIEPLAGSTPTLQNITKYDPEPHNIGSISTMTASTWAATDWIGVIQYQGTWLNQYVAVIEPPPAKGIVRIEEMVRTGAKVISPSSAVEQAREWIKKLGLDERAPYSILRRPGMKNHSPLLVREEVGLSLKKRARVPYYYMVPFGFERETGCCGTPLVRVCVIVNAFSGKFEEIGLFGAPFRYLSEKEAIARVAKAMRLERAEINLAEASLMFRPSDITHIRLNPFWRVAVAERVIYVDQLGVIYKGIGRSVPGD